MKNYIIEEITEFGKTGLKYFIEHVKQVDFVYLKEGLTVYEPMILLGCNMTETKRGWTFMTKTFAPKYMKVFLPREQFRKVEL